MGPLSRTRCASIQYRISIRIFLSASTASTVLIPNFILSTHIAVSNPWQEGTSKQNKIRRNYIGIIVIKRRIRLAFASVKNLCGIMNIFNPSHDCAPRHRKESGSQESCRFEKFRRDRFPGIKGGGRGATPGVVSVRFHCGPGGSSWGVPPILRMAELDDCAAVVQYMSDCRSCGCVSVCSACCYVFVLVLCTGSHDNFIKPVVVWRTMLLSTSVYW